MTAPAPLGRNVINNHIAKRAPSRHDNTSAGQAQRFLSVHDQVGNLFRRPANTNAVAHRQSRARAFTTWAEVTGLAAGF
jgi:hypothetical protein